MLKTYEYGAVCNEGLMVLVHQQWTPGERRTARGRRLAKTAEGVDMLERLRQNLRKDHGCPEAMEKLVKGFLKFRGEVFGKKRELFTRLSQKQEPRALFITCSDSRVDPTLMTQTEPGELFILRNAGNMVPPYGSMQGGSTATIEFAMAVLKVPHIIVCGHTDCGVMKALLQPEEVHDLPALKEWVGQAETTRRLMREHYIDLEGNDRLVKTTQENVRAQLDHLRTHPSVALQLRKGTVDLHGWVYSIPTGDIWVYDFESEQFTPLLDETPPRLKVAG